MYIYKIEYFILKLKCDAYCSFVTHQSVASSFQYPHIYIFDEFMISFMDKNSQMQAMESMIWNPYEGTLTQTRGNHSFPCLLGFNKEWGEECALTLLITYCQHVHILDILPS